MKKILTTIIIVVYAICAIAVTILLFGYNNYNCSVLGDYTFLIVKANSSLASYYDKGSLLIVKATTANNVNINDDIIMYQIQSKEQYEIIQGKVSIKTEQGSKIFFTLENGTTNNSEYLIGKASETISISHLGTILSVVESKWGYLFSVVIVTLLLFLQELFELVLEIRYGIKEEKEREYLKYATSNGADISYEEEGEEEKPRKATRKASSGKTTSTARTRKTTENSSTKATNKKATTTSRTTNKSTSKKNNTENDESIKKKSARKTANGTEKEKRTTTAKKNVTQSTTKKATEGGKKASATTRKTTEGAKKTSATTRKTTEGGKKATTAKKTSTPKNK
jgi:hypothetical protein